MRASISQIFVLDDKSTSGMDIKEETMITSSSTCFTLNQSGVRFCLVAYGFFHLFFADAPLSSRPFSRLNLLKCKTASSSRLYSCYSDCLCRQSASPSGVLVLAGSIWWSSSRSASMTRWLSIPRLLACVAPRQRCWRSHAAEVVGSKSCGPRGCRPMSWGPINSKDNLNSNQHMLLHSCQLTVWCSGWDTNKPAVAGSEV